VGPLWRKTTVSRAFLYVSFRVPSKGYIHITRNIKKKTIPLQAWPGLSGSRRLRLPEFLDSMHMKVVRLSAQHIGLPLHGKRYSWYSFLLEVGLTPGLKCGQKD